jgi:hypothetical protein
MNSKPKPSDRTQRTRAPEQGARRYVESAERLWVIVKKVSNSFSALVLWGSVVLLSQISLPSGEISRCDFGQFFC